MPPRRLPHRALPVVLLLWAAAAAAGFATLAAYETAPGAAGAPPPAWPGGRVVPAPDGLPVLVVVAHPQCPCTRATVSELERLMRRVHGRVSTHVLFVQPDGTDEAWVEGDLWRRASAVPGVRTVRDPGGHGARRFGALTSGHALLYDARGRLRYSGGLTATRGHEGDNAGRTAVESLLTRGDADLHAAPVYGCPLQQDHPSS